MGHEDFHKINIVSTLLMLQVEFCYPPLKYGEADGRPVMPPEWQYITALALPDGAHLATEGNHQTPYLLVGFALILHRFAPKPYLTPHFIQKTCTNGVTMALCKRC